MFFLFYILMGRGSNLQRQVCGKIQGISIVCRDERKSYSRLSLVFFPTLSITSSFLKTSRISNAKFSQNREGIWRKNEFIHVVSFFKSSFLHYEQFQKS